VLAGRHRADSFFNSDRFGSTLPRVPREDPAARVGPLPRRLGSNGTSLLAVVDQTMQPTQGSLWLRPRRARG
jgi:hypothetical protein